LPILARCEEKAKVQGENCRIFTFPIDDRNLITSGGRRKNVRKMSGRRLNREISKDAQVFKSRLIYSVNTIAGFWLGIGGFFSVVIFFIWGGLQHEQQFHNGGIIFAILLANGVLLVLVLVPGKLLAMWPYAVVLEPQKGIWVYAPPMKLWVPFDEIVDVDVYSGMYGGGHVIRLSRSHGLVKQLYFNSLFFPHEQLVRELRVLIDRRDGVVYTS
jgi:hypothetical protein